MVTFDYMDNMDFRKLSAYSNNLVLIPITGWYAKTRKRLGRLGSYSLLNSSSEEGRYNVAGKFFVLFYQLLSKLIF